MAHQASSILDRLDSGLQQQKEMATSARNKMKQEAFELGAKYGAVKVKMELDKKSHGFEDYEEDHSNIYEDNVKLEGVMRKDAVMNTAPTTPRTRGVGFDAPSAPRIMREAEQFLERTHKSPFSNPTITKRLAQSAKAEAANEKKRRKAEAKIAQEPAREAQEAVNRAAKGKKRAQVADDKATKALLNAANEEEAEAVKARQTAEKVRQAAELADLEKEAEARISHRAEKRLRKEAAKVSEISNKLLQRRFDIEAAERELLDEVSRRALESEKLMLLRDEVRAREAAGSTGSQKKFKRAQQALEAALREDLATVPDPPELLFGTEGSEIEKLNEGTVGRDMDAIEADHDSGYRDDLLSMFGDGDSGVSVQESRTNSSENVTAKRKPDTADLANDEDSNRRDAKRMRKEKKALKSGSGTKKSKKSKSNSEETSCQKLTNGHNDEGEMLDHDDQQLHHDSPPKQLQNLRQIVQKVILPPKKQQATTPGAPVLPREDPKNTGTQISEQLVPNTPVQPEATNDPSQWMPAAWKDSFIGTVNHVRSTLREDSANDSAPNEQFSWLPSAQRESLLDTIRNGKTDGSPGVNTEKVFSAPKAPKSMVTFNLTPQPKLFSSGVYKSPASTSPAAELGNKSSFSSTLRTKNSVIIPVSVPHISAQAPMRNIVSSNRDSGATAATILPPARYYIVHGTPQVTISPTIFQQNNSSTNAVQKETSKAAPIFPTTPQQKGSSTNASQNQMNKASSICPTASQISSSPRAAGSAILPPNFKRSFLTPQAPSGSAIVPQASASKVILPPTRDSQPAAILPSSGIIKFRSLNLSDNDTSKDLNRNSNTPSTTTKLNALSISDKKSANEASTLAIKPKKRSSKSTHIDELPEEAEVREVSNKRQKRTITATGSPSPIPVPISHTHTRRKSDPPAVKRNLDLMLTQQEEWEVTGGRFRGRVNLSEDKNDDAEVEENIAFSSLYIQNRTKPIAIANLKFRILRLASGESSDLTSEKGVKVCSVARGRVKVNIAGKKFSIGENGMWRVRGGETCKIRNQISEEAVVHVSDVN